MATVRTRTAKKADGDESLDALRVRAATCKRCELWKGATQTVFGTGNDDADVMLVGEQPGDIEDRRSEPFVGPAGQLLRRALGDAGVDLGRVYLTNAVKHFKWTPRGKRRIHERPNHDEVLACHLWLELEIARVRPRVLVALGATAASALLGSTVRVTRDRAQLLESPLAEFVSVSVHPSSILRSADSESRAAAYAQFVDDLRRIVRYAGRKRTSGPSRGGA